MQPADAATSPSLRSLFLDRHRSLFSPGIDFLTVGGLSYIFILFIQFYPLPIVLNYTIAIGLAYIINDPHFLSSYQLFYSNFREKLSGRHFSRFMHVRFLFAGFAVPALILAYFAYSLATNNPQLLFFSANIMLFLVGWHYTKQSYGMLITLSVFKQVYYNERAKKILLWNTYFVWFATWIYMNHAISEMNFFGINLSFFSFPQPVLYTALALCMLSGALSLYVLLQHFAKTGQISINGLIGYSTAYIWLFFRWSEPSTYILIPMFHSLQYLPFILRYKINESAFSGLGKEGEDIMEHTKEHARYTPEFLVLRFVLFALFLGFLSFHALPSLFDTIVPYNTVLYGNGLFLFLFAIFINIHHYFIDNVLWRKENKDISKYLFARA